MTDPLPTVGLTLLGGLELSKEELARLRSTAAMGALAGRLARAATGPLWSALGARIVDGVKAALDTPLSTVLVEAWNRYGSFRPYLDPVRYPPEKISVVTLARHTARATYRPTVLVTVGDFRAELKLEAELALTLEAGALSIQAGRFKELRPGTCSAEGTLRCEGAVLLHRQLPDFTLPGVVSFGAGIPIGHREEVAPAPLGA